MSQSVVIKLFVVNSVSKKLQSKAIHIEVVIDQLKGLISFSQNYREHGFTYVMISSKDIAAQINRTRIS